MEPIYLDNQASTRMDTRVIEAMAGAGHGNPHSSGHAYGWEASRKVDDARESVAALIGSDPDEIFFTSGATEANNIALLGLRDVRRAESRLIARPLIEHKSVLGACEALAYNFGFEVYDIPISADGTIDSSSIKFDIMNRAAIISSALVNNEIGTIQDVEVFQRFRSTSLLHCDGAQAPAAMSMERTADRCDLLSLSGHKMGGPMGIGALYISRPVQKVILPIMYGGDQQNGIRPGTLPLPLCVGMGVACDIAKNNAQKRDTIAKVRDYFISCLIDLGVRFRLNGPSLGSLRHPGNANLSFETLDANQLLAMLQPKLAASTGSACTSGSLEPSYVLTAIGLSYEEASSSIRFSFGSDASETQAFDAAKMIADALLRLK